MPSLQYYIEDTSTLLHDQNLMFTSRKQLVRAINEARRRAAYMTRSVKRIITGQSAFGVSSQPGQIRPGFMQPGALPGAVPVGSAGNLIGPNYGPPAVAGAAVGYLQTSPGVERYPYHGLFNNYLKRQHAGCKAIFDTVSFAVNWGGAVRPALAWMPWQDLQAYARAYATLVTSYPYYWTVENDGEQGNIWMFPAPSTNGDMELEGLCTPMDLNTDDDFEVLPEAFADAIKYGACAHIYKTSQRFLQAQLMDQDFLAGLGVGSVSRDAGKTPNYYFTAI